MKPPRARQLALTMLAQTLDANRDVQSAIHAVLSKEVQSVDTGLATELTYGLLRYKLRLDCVLRSALAKPDQIPPLMWRILELALYEILFLDRIPAYASLDWSVSLVRRHFGKTMSRVANGVLRTLTRQQEYFREYAFYRAQTRTAQAAQAAWYSIPEWMLSLWQDACTEEEVRSLAQAGLAAPHAGIRINRLAHGAADLRAELQPKAQDHADWGLAFEALPEQSTALIRAGRISRQSFALQQCLKACAPQSWPEPIFDVCCGRGGKTFALAEAGKTLWAADPHPGRLRQFREESLRLGLEIPVWRGQGQTPYPLASPPQTILLDVPCSGLGVLSRRPDTKWKRTLQECHELAHLQSRILDTAATALPHGGVLIYLTCTVNKAENEGQIQRFLQRHPRFSVESMYQTDLHDHLGEFFFAARLQAKK